MTSLPYEDSRRQHPRLTSAEDSPFPALPGDRLECSVPESLSWLIDEECADSWMPEVPQGSLLGDSPSNDGLTEGASKEGETSEPQALELADLLQVLVLARTPLSYVRSEYLDPYVTQDSYRFQDGNLLVLTSAGGSAERLAHALRCRQQVVLLGYCWISGSSYALTFAVEDETVYILADHGFADSDRHALRDDT